MKIEVWTPPDPKPEPEKVALLRLSQVGNTAYVEVVDAYGRLLSRGWLLTVSETGVRRELYVDPSLGFPLDHKGRIKLVGED